MFLYICIVYRCSPVLVCWNPG